MACSFANDIAYCPATRPQRFSALRRAASEQGISRILGPDQDPEGWSSFGPTIICGEIFGDRHVEVSCTVSVCIELSNQTDQALFTTAALACETGA